MKLDLTNIDDSPTDYFIVCEGDSITQVKSISNRITKRVREELGISPNHVEGMTASKWILVDYFSTIVHVFYPETRSHYDIEELWSDANIVTYEDIL